MGDENRKQTKDPSELSRRGQQHETGEGLVNGRDCMHSERAVMRAEEVEIQ